MIDLLNRQLVAGQPSSKTAAGHHGAPPELDQRTSQPSKAKCAHSPRPGGWRRRPARRPLIRNPTHRRRDDQRSRLPHSRSSTRPPVSVHSGRRRRTARSATRPHRLRVSDHSPDGRRIVPTPPDLTPTRPAAWIAHGWAVARRPVTRGSSTSSAIGGSGSPGRLVRLRRREPARKHVHVSIKTRTRFGKATAPWFDGFLVRPATRRADHPAPAPPITRPVPPAAAHIPSLGDDDAKATSLNADDRSYPASGWRSATGPGCDLAILAETQDGPASKGCPRPKCSRSKPGAMRTSTPSKGPPCSA